MSSSRYNHLEQRISELSGYFLPSEWSPVGEYVNRVHEHARAFRVLAHAEFESFIEDRAVETANDAYEDWKSTGKPSVCILSLAAYRSSTHGIPSSLEEAARENRYPDLSLRIKHARDEFNRYVKTENHGIKERNILRIMMPLGFAVDELNTTWLNVTEAWAKKRGDAAHRAGKAQRPPDPKKELETVHLILEGFGEIDMAMFAKRNSA